VVLSDRSIEGKSIIREVLTKEGKLGLHLFEDLTTLAAGGSVCSNRMTSISLNLSIDV